MELKFTVGGRISKPVAEVFEAVVDPAQLSEFFTTGGARGRIEAGAEVTWDFMTFPVLSLFWCRRWCRTKKSFCSGRQEMTPAPGRP